MEGPERWRIKRKALDRLKSILRKEGGAEVSDDEARGTGQVLLSLFETAGKHQRDVRLMEERLADSPEGYRLHDTDYRCWICGSVNPHAPLWFDRTGVKCEHCYLMFKRRALPLSVATDRESWYSDDDLKWRLGWGPRRVRSMVAAGKLVPRTVRGTGFRIFLISENPSLPRPRPDIWCPVEGDGTREQDPPASGNGR